MLRGLRILNSTSKYSSLVFKKSLNGSFFSTLKIQTGNLKQSKKILDLQCFPFTTNTFKVNEFRSFATNEFRSFATIPKSTSTETVERLWRNAVMSGDMRTIVRIAGSGFDINSRLTNSSKTALVIACEKGNFEMARYLLENGSNPTRFLASTSLHSAISIKSESIILLLLDWALSKGDVTLSKLLSVQVVGQTPLAYSIISNDLKSIKIILSYFHSFLPEQRQTQLNECLMLALDAHEKIEIPILEALLNAGANINYVLPRSGRTPLLNLLLEGDVARIEQATLYLLNRPQIDPTISHSKNGVTPLMIASGLGMIDVVKKIMKITGKEHVNHTNSVKENALFIATREMRSEMIKLLLENGANPNIIQQFSHMNALMQSIHLNSFGNTLILLSSGKCDPIQQNESLFNSIHFAARVGNVSIMQLLLEHIKRNKIPISSILIENKFKNNALKIAITNGNLEMVKILIPPTYNALQSQNPKFNFKSWILELNLFAIKFNQAHLGDFFIDLASHIPNNDHNSFPWQKNQQQTPTQQQHQHQQTQQELLSKLISIVSLGDNVEEMKNFVKEHQLTPSTLANAREEGTGNSILLESVRFGSNEIVSYLLDLFSTSQELIEISLMANKSSQNPISLAIQSKNELISNLFLNSEHPFSKSLSKKRIESGFLMTIKAGMEKMAIEMLSKHPYLFKLVSEGESLLNISVSSNCVELTKELLVKGSDPLSTSSSTSGKSGFILAFNQSLSTLSLVSTFLRFSANSTFLRLKDHQIESLVEVLSILNVENAKPIISLLLEYGIDLKSTQLLRECLKQGNKSLFTLLINEFKFPANSKDNGVSLMHEATRLGMIDVMKLILENGVSINEVEPKNGQTALMIASIFGRVEVIGWLLENGASLDIQDKQGKTALLLRPTGNTALLLTRFATYIQGQNELEYGAYFAGKRDEGERIRSIDLIHSISESSANSLELAFYDKRYAPIRKGMGFDDVLISSSIVDKEGNNALLVAALKGDWQSCFYLVRVTSNLLHSNFKGESAIQIFISSNSWRLVDLVLRCLNPKQAIDLHFSLLATNQIYQQRERMMEHAISSLSKSVNFAIREQNSIQINSKTTATAHRSQTTILAPTVFISNELLKSIERIEELMNQQGRDWISIKALDSCLWMFLHSGKFSSLKRLIERSLSLGLKPLYETTNKFLFYFASHGNVDMVEYLLLTLWPNQSEIPLESFAHLLSAYLKIGDSDSVSEVLSFLKPIEGTEIQVENVLREKTHSRTQQKSERRYFGKGINSNRKQNQTQLSSLTFQKLIEDAGSNASILRILALNCIDSKLVEQDQKIFELIATKLNNVNESESLSSLATSLVKNGFQLSDQFKSIVLSNKSIPSEFFSTLQN